MAKRRSSKPTDEILEKAPEPVESFSVSSLEAKTEVPEVESFKNAIKSEREERLLGKVAPKSTPAPRTKLPNIPLKVFLTLSKSRWDQMAGFQNFATRENLGPMTVPEWRAAVESFKNRPTKPI